MSRRTAIPTAAAVLFAGALLAAPAGAGDLVLDKDGALNLPADHAAALAKMNATGHAALANVAKGVMPTAAMPETMPASAMPDGTGPGDAMPADPLAPGAEETAADGPGPIYSARNLRDPFALPAEVRAPEARSEDVPPLERVPLSDFKLVAVVKKHGSHYAMVASSDGKGYTLGVGTRIGSDGGEVRRIMPDAVIVEQVHADEFGELKKNEIVLGLRPEEVVP